MNVYVITKEVFCGRDSHKEIVEIHADRTKAKIATEKLEETFGGQAGHEVHHYSFFEETVLT
jgi:hypothetical protein